VLPHHGKGNKHHFLLFGLLRMLECRLFLCGFLSCVVPLRCVFSCKTFLPCGGRDIPGRMQANASGWPCFGSRSSWLRTPAACRRFLYATQQLTCLTVLARMSSPRARVGVFMWSVEFDTHVATQSCDGDDTLILMRHAVPFPDHGVGVVLVSCSAVYQGIATWAPTLCR